MKPDTVGMTRTVSLELVQARIGALVMENMVLQSQVDALRGEVEALHQELDSLHARLAADSVDAAVGPV